MITVGLYADIGRAGGGVRTFLQNLITTLLDINNPDIRYVIFTDPLNLDYEQWLEKQSSQCLVVSLPSLAWPTDWRKWLYRFERFGIAASYALQGKKLQAQVTLDRLKRHQVMKKSIVGSPWPLDLMHFPFQEFAAIPIPFIYCPWDLQHLHLMDLWPNPMDRWRDSRYRLGCQLSTHITTGSQWVKQDLIDKYQIAEEKITSIPIAPPQQYSVLTDTELAEIKQKFQLPEQFMFYPATTYQHKNHARLIDVMKKLKQQGSQLILICCGVETIDADPVKDEIKQQSLDDQFRFLGRLTDQEVHAIYQQATFCLYPSRFEGAGFPVLESFSNNCPLVTSKVDPIPEYAGDAAIYFDPDNSDSIVEAIQQMMQSSDKRNQLIDMGKKQLEQFSWQTNGMQHIELYKKLVKK